MPELIQWPDSDGDYRLTGENGMAAWAVFRSDRFSLPIMAHCCGSDDCVLIANEVIVDSPVLFPDHGKQGPESSHSVPLIGCILLGSTRNTYYSERLGRYWHCTWDDLTTAGLAIVKSLETMYGQKAEFVTFLDTRKD